jgi:hypothetical protein
MTPAIAQNWPRTITGSNGNSRSDATLYDAGDASLAVPWEQCLARADPRSQFCTPGWYTAWLSTIGGRRAPWTGIGCVITAMADSGEAIGVLPLAMARYYGFDVVSFAGYFQPHRTPVWAADHESRAAAAIADVLFGGDLRWHVARFYPIDLSSAGNLALLEQLRARSPRVEVRSLEPTIVISQLPDSFDEYERQVLGLKFARQIQYYSRKAVREAAMTIRHFHDPKGESLEPQLVLRGTDSRRRPVHHRQPIR